MNRAHGFILRMAPALLCLAAGSACVDPSATKARLDDPPPVGDQLFSRLPPEYTGVFFENRIEDTRDLNVFTYRNYYNGGGVALGDLTGDGLPEILLTSNLDANRLYLNEGEFRLRDVTEQAGVAGNGRWTTGVTFADINGDGLLDVYVCYAGDVAEERRANELYIHQGLDADGVPVFAEMAATYGIADEGMSTHAAFFDYDRDGYLDLYVVNNSFRPVSSFSLENIRHVPHEFGGDRLYRNLGGRFVDVSERAGIFQSEIAFGLGVAVGDVNRDGWPDIYVANDFFERDYLYVNKGDGTFAELLEEQMPTISLSSMGLDIADINNDGWLDLYVADMLPEDNYRLKTTSQFEGWDSYQNKLKNDYHHQFMRTMLQLNNGNGTFSEIGQMAGVARTDWTWGALIADFDQDGNKDIHVTNGILRDVTSQDYIAFLANPRTMRVIATGDQVDFLALIQLMSSTKLPNYAFRNGGRLSFSNAGALWGLNTLGFSSGAAYGDLNGDGAPDLVVNNVNQEASIYRNNARTLLDNRYLKVSLAGEGPNRFGIGAKVTLRSGEHSFFQELMPSRGFQSSVDYALTFGVGQLDTIQSVTVEWPDGSVTVLRDVAANQALTVRQSAATAVPPEPTKSAPLFTDVTTEIGLDFAHRENEFVDFRREPLLPKLLSTEGPFMAVADVNGDGLTDAFIGGAREQPGQLLIQQPDGSFVSGSRDLFAGDQISEDLGAVFFDATGDSHPDLYVVSGGSEFSATAPALQDRLYLNDGRGGFRKAEGHLPPMIVSGSRVTAHDFDADGDTDLFVGGRVIPWRYGFDARSVLLVNDGRGRFTDVTEQVAPDLAEIGMVTDAVWEDVDGDGRTDLVVVGEWMPIAIFHNSGSGKLTRMVAPGLEQSHGWWNRIVAGDFTGDGRTDFVVGNLGLNMRLRATADQPVTMHVMDFDRNGVVDQIVSNYSGGVSYPITLRDDLLMSLPVLRGRYRDYESYARQTVTDLFTPDHLAQAVLKQAYTFETALVLNVGDGSFTLVPLPPEAQIAPVYGILAGDYDRDGNLDLLLAGNFDGFKPEIGRMSGSYGLFLRGAGSGTFTPIRSRQSGFLVPGQSRDIQRVSTRRGELYVVTRNNDRPLIFRLSPATGGRGRAATDPASSR
jgi:hypothetical protein